jgi:hypothetical protein
MTRTIRLVTAVIGASCLVALGGTPAGAASGREVAHFIEVLEVGEPVRYENLTVIPVYTKERSFFLDLATLDQALEKKWLRITEVEDGRVPQVKVTNLSDGYVYLMGGEVLTGCRQDRIIGRDVILGPKHKDVIVPVYCVERGRWTYESDQFYSKKNLGTAQLRAEAQKGLESAQARIWSEVGDLHVRGGRAGETRFQEAFDSEAAGRRIAVVEDRMAALPRLYPDAVGVVIGVGDQIVSADVFAAAHVFQALWPKILRSAALATVGRKDWGSIGQDDAARFLAGLHDKRYIERPAVDLGSELTAMDHEVNVNALVYTTQVFHLAAFPEGSAKVGEKSQDSERRIPVWRRQ